jgi:hypothetical protein
MERYNNWMSYSFDGNEYGSKKNKNSVMSINFNNKVSKSLPTYKDALFNNARIMRDSYREPFDICLSGGIDSEVVIRVFKELGITHNTFIFRCENNYNVRDVTGAISLCEELNIPYKIIDFNLQQFYENDAIELLRQTYTPYAGRLPRLKFIDYLDNIPIFCDGEPYWKRLLGNDYSQKSKWVFELAEQSYGVSIYANQINRLVIGDWYEYTPEVILTYAQLPYVQKLLNDQIVGKTSNVTSKVSIHQEYFPSIKHREKLVGYEGENGEIGSRPDFMSDFYNNYMQTIKNTTFKYTESELFSLLTKDTY